MLISKRHKPYDFTWLDWGCVAVQAAILVPGICIAIYKIIWGT